jgi:uncharacterized membrane protein YqjE
MSERKLFDVSKVRDRQSVPGSRPIGDIVRDILNQISEIVRSEFRLISVEVKQEASELKTAGISIAVGNVLLIYGGLFFLLGALYALSIVWPLWLASLVIGTVVAAVGVVALKIGVNRLKRPRWKRD